MQALDGMIAVLELIVAMEALDDVDADDDMQIELPEILLSDKDGNPINHNYFKGLEGETYSYTIAY